MDIKEIKIDVGGIYSTYENIPKIELEVYEGESYEKQYEEDDYVVSNNNHSSKFEGHSQNKENENEGDVNSNTETKKYGHDNIYLQQIPSRNKCKVESSVYDVYENDNGDTLDNRNEKVIKNASTQKQEFCVISFLRSPICKKIIWVIVGMILIGVPISGSLIASYYTPTKEMSTGNYNMLI